MDTVREFVQFVKDAWEELKKVSWLSRGQVLASTWFVVFLVIIFSIYVGFLDLVVSRIFGFFI